MLATWSSLGAQGGEPETFPPSNSQSGHAHPAHPSSQSRSCASPPSTENLGPYWSPLLMLQPHLPPAGCRPQAQKWSWELAQNGDSMRRGGGGGGHSLFRRHCSPTPALEEAPGLCLGPCCLSALPVSLPLSSLSLPRPAPLCRHEDLLTSASLPASAFLQHSCSSLPTAFLSLCLWPYL